MNRPWPRLGKLTRPLLLPIASLLTACASPRPTVVTDAGCVVFPRLTFDRLKDTDATIAQVKAYDARRDAVCGTGQ